MRALIFDTETTGLINFKLPADDPTQPRLASLAAQLVDVDGAHLDGFYSLVRPDDWSEDTIAGSAQAFAVNGLSMERLMDEGIPLSEVLDRFDAMVDQSEVIAAYSLAFDQKVVRGEQRRLGRPDRYGARPTHDVLWGARKIYGGKIKTLSEAVRACLGREHVGAHDAMADLLATVELFQLVRSQGLFEAKPQVSKF